MAESGSATFFTRLRSLCRDVDKRMALLKEDLSVPPGTAPHLYDRGLNALKNDFQDIKKKNEEVNQVQGSVKNFSNWLYSMQELVNQQAEDITKMEQYLIKFGYVPLQSSATDLQSTDSKREDSGCLKSNVKEQSDSKPGLDVVVECVVQPKAASVQPKAAPLPKFPVKSVKSLTENMGYQKTPLSSRVKTKQSMKANAGLGSSFNNSQSGRSLTVEQWLQGIENSNLELTPEVLRTKRVPMRENEKGKEVTVECNKIPNNATLPKPEGTPDKVLPINVAPPEVSPLPVSDAVGSTHTLSNFVNTPEEPQLSEYTTQFLTLIPSAVRKEKNPSVVKQIFDRNVPSNVINSTIKRDCKTIPEETAPQCFVEPKTREMCTPEEPVRSYQGHNSDFKSFQKEECTPEEPVLSYQVSEIISKNRIDAKTPEEPVLSYQIPERITMKQITSKTPEEPVLSYQMPEHPSSKQIKTKTPEEPVLSYQIPKQIVSKQIDSKTPEEPVLSYQIPNSTSVTHLDNKTPEEPVLSAYAAVMQKSSITNSYIGNCDDMPASPQLSDVTQSFLSLANESYFQNSSQSIRKNSHQHKSQSLYGNNQQQFPGNGKGIHHNAQQNRLDTQVSKENLKCEANPKDSDKKWHRAGIAVEQFLGVDVDIPPSPQLSEVTQRLFARMY